MIEQDTVKLLRECDAGAKMGIASIGDVLDRVKDEQLHRLLIQCKQGHQALSDRIQSRLEGFRDEGKDPNPLAKSMSWMKTNMKLSLDHTDATVADLMTDGCNMGVKSLSRYLNQYKAADETSKDIAKELIHLEHQLDADIRPYL